MRFEPGGGERNRRDHGQSIGESYRTAHELLSASLSAGLLTYGGYWLDQRYGCLPVLTICGGVLGVISAVLAVRQVVLRMERQSLHTRDGVRHPRVSGRAKPESVVGPESDRPAEMKQD